IAVRKHIKDHVQGRQVVCHTDLDATCEDADAYNLRTGAQALMTLCPGFLDGADVGVRAATLVHEAAHGTPGVATDDLAYDHERLVLGLSTAEAMGNSDSYTLLVRNLVVD